MAHAIQPKTAGQTSDGIRPVNLRTDLAPLADLIELCFADTMDTSGRAALREMRTLSKLGPGLGIISRLNDMALGIGLGYVYVEDDQLLGNVSIYPANWPKSFGPTYIIANVATHPAHRGRGIARRLMQVSLANIQQKGGQRAILQVDQDNDHARSLYQSLGFVTERIFINWRRASSSRVPEPPSINRYIRRRRRSEWRDEFTLAQQVRPQAQGGLGWLRPLHPSQFKRGFWQTINDMLNLRGVERLVAVNNDELEAAIWVETAFANNTRLTVLTQPQARGTVDDFLLNNVVRRFGRSVLTCEHPADDVVMSGVLTRYRFMRQRTVVHMRWDA
jgi:GNAT superfamily N-acetyltransferase